MTLRLASTHLSAVAEGRGGRRNRALSATASIFASVALCATLTACHQGTRWQNAGDATGRYTADFPDAPKMEIDRIALDGGQEVSMRTQTATGKDGVTYAIGAMVLNDDSDAMRQAGQQALLDGMARNVANAGAPQSVSMPAADGSALAGQKWTSVDTVPGTQQQRVIEARFVAHGARVYEAVIFADHPAPVADAAHFFAAFKPQ